MKSFKNRQNWLFFKLDKSIDRGMPFTISNYIFLPSDVTISYNPLQIRDILIHEQVHIHQHNNIEKYVDYVICGDDVISNKPSPEPIWNICWNLDVTPSETIMVGDWPERDVVGAKQIWWWLVRAWVSRNG